MRQTIATIGAALCALTIVSAAEAQRGPTRAERRQIAPFAEPIPARCIGISVSTVNPDWAIFYSRGLQSCPGADGYVVMRKVDGAWGHVYDGGGTSGGPCENVAPMPPGAGDDLGICDLPRDCGTLRVDGANLPVRISQGELRCSTAKRVVRRYFPTSGRGDQSFTLSGKKWFCANSHGDELERGGVAHCASGWIRIVVRQPGG